MAEQTRSKSNVNFLSDVLLPLFAFASSATSPQGAAGAQGLLSALRVGERRRSGQRQDQRFQDALSFRQKELDFKREQQQPMIDLAKRQSDFRLGALENIEQTINAPGPGIGATLDALGPAQVGRLEQARARGEQVPLPVELPNQQVRQQRREGLSPTLLADAGLQNAASARRDPQFAKRQQDLMLAVAKLPDKAFPKDVKRQVRQEIADATDMAGLTQLMAGVPFGQETATPGDYGFGPQLDSAIFSLFGDDLQGGKPTPTMVEQARKKLQDEKVQISQERGSIAGERQAAVSRAKMEAQKEFESKQMLLDARPEGKSRLFFRKEDAGNVDQAMLMSDVKKGIKSGEFLEVNKSEAKAIEGFRNSAPVLQKIRSQLEKLYGSGGIFDNLEPGFINRLKAGGQAKVAQFLQSDPELVATIRNITGNIDVIRRNLAGQVGTQTERDAIRGLTTLPSLDGILPDTKEVAYQTFNNLTTLFNGSVGGILGKEDFAFPGLSPMGTQQQPVPGVREDTVPQASIRQQLKATGMSDEEINKAIGRTP